nr:hypothetical protein [Tanacetum cinerariifolium]
DGGFDERNGSGSEEEANEGKDGEVEEKGEEEADEGKNGEGEEEAGEVEGSGSKKNIMRETMVI